MKNDKKTNAKWINARTMRYGSYAVILTAIALALLFGLNAILGIDRIHTALKIDITKNKLFSVGDQTQKVLKEMTKDVEFIVLTPEEEFSSTLLKEIFKQYALKSNGKLSIRYVDLDKDPQFVTRELDPDSITGITKGSLVVKCGKKVRVVEESEMQDTQYDYQTGQSYSNGLLIEQAFTGAILNVTSDITPVVYFLTGHGEMGVESDLSTLKGTLDINNYEVKELALTGAMPEDASVVVIANPATDLLGEETAILNDWLKTKGGNMIVLADANAKAPAMPNLDSVLEGYNLKLNNDVVMEGNQQNYLDKQNYVIPRVAANDITTQLDPNSVMLLLPNSRTVEILNNTKEWIKSFAIFQTSEDAARLDVASGYKDPIKGQFLMGAATTSTGGSKESKVVVLGNATFITNDSMKQTTDNGKRYLLTMVNWMQNKTDEILIPAKDYSAPALTVTEQSTFFIFLALVILLPLAVIGTGIFVWFRRKHL